MSFTSVSPGNLLRYGDTGALSDRGGFRAGRLRAGGDPFFDQRDLFAGELLFALWHLPAVNHLEEQAPVRLAGNEHRAVVTTLEHQPAQAQVEAAFEFLPFAMTLETMRLEDRPDVFFERHRRGGEDGCGSKQQQTADRYKGARLCPPRTSRSSTKAREALRMDRNRIFIPTRCGWSSTQPRSTTTPYPLHAFRRISFTTRHGLVSVMRSSCPLWR